MILTDMMVDEIECPYCGTMVDEDEDWCPECDTYMRGDELPACFRPATDPWNRSY